MVDLNIPAQPPATCVAYDIGVDLLGDHSTARGVQVAARFAWRRYPIHSQEVTLVALGELLAMGATGEARSFIDEALRELDRRAHRSD